MNQTLPPAEPLMLAIAEALGALAHEAEVFGIALCGDADVATRYLVQLQQVDRLAQSLREISRVVSAPDQIAAVNAICLGELRAELEKALAA